MPGWKASPGGQVGPRGPEASSQPLAAPLVASQEGNRALGLTPVLGDTGTAALLSGFLLRFESPPRSAQCQERSQGPVLPGLCSSPQSPKLRVAEEWVGGVPEDQRSASEADATTSRGVTHTQRSPGSGGARLAR